MMRTRQTFMLILTLSLLCPGGPAFGAGEAGEAALPQNLIPYAFQGETDHVILVEKASQRLYLYAYDGAFRQVLMLDCSTGKADGDKIVAGDGKTPEGVYFFIDEHDDKHLAPIYGVKAFVTDYPNVMDRMAGKTGNSIWLHGTDRPLKPRDSNGCVALNNDDLRKLIPYITLYKTPIIITETLKTSDPDKTAAQDVDRLLSEWAAALNNGAYHDYLNYYAPEYVPDIAWWADWRVIRERTAAAGHPITSALQHPSVYRYKDIYVAMADQRAGLAEAEADVGKKVFFFKSGPKGMRIVGEEYLGAHGQDAAERHPFVLACMDLESAGLYETEIAKLVEGWIDAWSSKDIERYGAYYAGDFRAKGMNLRAYLAYKQRLNRKYDYIRVTQSNLEITPDGDVIRAAFTQRYESSAFRTVGKKELVFKRENGRWKIFRENYEG